eukprot:1147711-Pelagomonas_calceolata.AAC.1
MQLLEPRGPTAECSGTSRQQRLRLSVSTHSPLLKSAYTGTGAPERVHTFTQEHAHTSVLSAPWQGATWLSA